MIESKTLILNGSDRTVFQELRKSLETCKSFFFNVAFINYGGLQLFLKLIHDLKEKGISGNIITSTYLNFSDPKALKKLYSFDNINLKVYHTIKERGFHSKAYIFEFEDHYKVIIGSSNITASAMKSNIEWNVEIVSKKNDPFMIEVIDEFTDMWESIEAVDDHFLDEYEQFINALKEKNKKQNNSSYFAYDYVIQPNVMQQRAIANLNKIRKYGEKKALVIAATGTGKTYMSAFDLQQFKAKRVLFVVHREDILVKAEESFKRVLGSTIQTGFLTGREKAYESKYLFSTIQTLYKNVEMFNKDEFDYIILDEAHHIAGDTYQKIINYFEPEFLLGMTATPERCDNFDIFSAFDNNVAIEIRLHEAMDEELVVPFHYFGITDIEEVDLSGINLESTQEIAKRLKINQRVDYIIEKMNLYGYDGDKRKCLGFCVNIDHANFMCAEFNKRGIKSVCLTGADNTETRNEYMQQLENDNSSIEVVFTVDIFNEGIDIPSVNLVLMLRPTNSPIIFIQQLGRGLRKSEGKEYLTVLDFIGNHNRAFLIAVALKGSRYYDKDSLKVSVANDFVNIPGDTFVQLDRISKERILGQLEFENFNSMRYLKDEYLSFKALLKGRMPTRLMDYLQYEGAPDPIKFIRSQGTYQNFLVKVEKDNNKCQTFIEDETNLKIMKYLSDMLPLKRPFEYAILLELCEKTIISVDDCEKSCLKYINYVNDDSVKHAIEVLNFNYYDTSQSKRWQKMIEICNQSIHLDSAVLEKINIVEYKEHILDILHYGLTRYQNEFTEKNYGTPFFKLYAQYSMQEVALLSNYRKMHSSFRGSGLLTLDNDYFLFVDLHKDSDIKESINYKDKFINKKYFQWQTPNSTSQESERGKNIIYNKERGITLHLFIRKFKEIDHQIQPYVYVGRLNSIKHSGEKPITVEMKLENELPISLFDELVNKIDIKKIDVN